MSHLESSSANYVSNLLSVNRNWAQRLNQTFPRYFPNPGVDQRPKLLWVGCSDSRVQESDATTALPGEIFVHRNIANQFPPNDNNVLSVFVYAVTALQVRDVVIVGHDHCGGAISALRKVRPTAQKGEPEDCFMLCDSYHEYEDGSNEAQYGEAASAPSPTKLWLERLVKRVRKLEQDGRLPADARQAVKVIVEENVRLQVEGMDHRDVTRWIPERAAVTVRGWVYDFSNGFLREVPNATKVLRRSST